MSTSKPGLFRLALHRIMGEPHPEPQRQPKKKKKKRVKTYTITGNIPPRFALIIPAERRS